MIADIVVDSHDGELASRVTIFGGTRRYVHEARFGPQLYRAGAFLPRGESRSPTEEEIEALTPRAGSDRGRSNTIGIVRIRQRLVRALLESRGPEGRIPDDAVLDWPFCKLAGALGSRWRLRGPLRPLGFAQNPAGFHTVTFDATSKRFIGLHLDDIEALPMGRREQSMTRLCINLGQSPRFLLFVNLTTRTIASWLSRYPGVGAFPEYRSTPLVDAFLRKFPDYPVVRLALHPGEAYLAPTENMVHDGSTRVMVAPDIQVTLLGPVDPI